MFGLQSASIKSLMLHKVGNKTANEGVHISKTELDLNEELREILKRYFISAFKSEEFFNLNHESDLKLNEIFSFASEIFDNPDSLVEQSKNIAKHLYEQSTHPKVKEGEFYVVYFEGAIIEGESTNVIGLFKSENKDTFLKISQLKDNFNINLENGININKLDKGCLIINKEKEKGFLVSIVDNLSKGNDAQYWKDDFLNVKPRSDNFYNTNNILTLCKNFVIDKLPEDFQVSRADQADLLNKSVKFFQNNEKFSMDNFTDEVIEDPKVIASFNNYRREFSDDFDVPISDEFEISSQALKKQQRIFKSVIKLDKNFHIYIHGNKELIEKGYDDATGMHYYKMFFKVEN
ncbi:MAG: nucleoid-associated protein [Bacteroidia bacterium]|nr:nucleoid-associated protein [Bacteroidia bacterium]